MGELLYQDQSHEMSFGGGGHTLQIKTIPGTTLGEEPIVHHIYQTP